MSYNVLLILEDFIKDQYVVKPIIEKLLADVGKPNANVEVCRNPRLCGISQCCSSTNINKILNMYRKFDLFLLIVDRDGDVHRRARLTQLEEEARAILREGKSFLAEHAIEEIEVWLLAGYDEGWVWKDVREHPHPKETYYQVFAENQGVAADVGQGGKVLTQQAMRNWTRMKTLCPEDLGNLEKRLKDII